MKQMSKRLLAFVLCAVMLLALLPTQTLQTKAYSETDIAYPVEGGNIYFDKETGTITGADQSIACADIPAEIDGVTVTAIGDEAFYFCEHLRDVTIPNSVTSIGFFAFFGCTFLWTITILNPDCSINYFPGTLGTNYITSVIGYAGSTAHAYANEFGYGFAALHEHSLVCVYICTSAGNIPYWYCDGCGKYFSDEEATFEQIPVPVEAHSYDVNDNCTVCGCSFPIDIEMTDSGYGQGWIVYECAVLVYEDDVLIKEFTFEKDIWSDGIPSTETDSLDYYADREYRFAWKKGYCSEECSFKIKQNETILYDCADASVFADGEVFLTIGAVESTEPKLDETMSAEMNITAGAEMAVNYVITADDVADFEDFYLVVEKESADGENTATTYGVVDKATKNEDRKPLNVTYHPVTGEILTYSATYEGINAKEMGDSFTTTLYGVDKNGVTHYKPMDASSMKDYLLERLNDPEATDVLKTMVVDMLKYGAVAQVNFNYDTENLVTADLTDAQLALGTQEIPEATDHASVTGEGANVNTNITVNSKVELSLSCIAAGQTEVKCIVTNSEGKTLAELDTVNIGGVMYSAIYDNVGAKEMREVITATFVDGNGNAISKTVNWSVESYVAQTRARTDATETEIAMVNAMLTYGDSVAAYMAAK